MSAAVCSIVEHTESSCNSPDLKIFPFEAWEQARNGLNKKINWQFTTEKTRIKLKRLYPSYDR
jgi:hypothetical protein